MIGSPRVHHRVVGSTNLVTRELAATGAPHGTVVTADEQSAGRGRGDRTWTAPAGSSLLMSVVVRPADPLLPLRAAVALCDTLADLDAVAIKWPNDVLVGGAKVAGILVEGRPQEGWAVLGMGVNVTASPPGLDRPATSIAEAGGSLSVDELFVALTAALDERVAQSAADALDAWRARDTLIGTEISWQDGAGTAAGVDERGALIVDTSDGRVTLDAGEVHLGTVG